MEGFYLLRSKLKMPELPNSVQISNRISEIIKKAENKKIITVTAPAGFGKTTLLNIIAKDFENAGFRICWLGLDDKDKALFSFLYYISASLLPSNEGESYRNKLSSASDLENNYHRLLDEMCSVLWLLRDDGHPPFCLVIDDFQHTAESSRIVEIMQYLFIHLPHDTVFIVGSRSDTLVLTPALKLTYPSLEIKHEHLLLKAAEVKELIGHLYRLDFSPDQIKRIHKLTEGWVAGIILLCQMLGNGQYPLETVSLKADQKSMIFNYITSEVLDLLDTEITDFLINICMLKEFTIEEASAILEKPGIERLLERCESKGLFLQKTITNEISYHFHTLFREALLWLREKNIPIEERERLNKKAAEYLIKSRKYNKALDHFVASNDITGAVSLISEQGINLMFSGFTRNVEMWLEILPTDIICQSPVLLYFKAHLVQLSNPREAVILINEACRLFAAQGSFDMHLKSLMLLSHIYVFQNDITAFNRVTNQLLSMLSPVNVPAIQELANVIQLSLYCWEDRLAIAKVLVDNLQASSMEQDWEWAYLAYSSITSLRLGQLDSGLKYIMKAMNLNAVKYNESTLGMALRICAEAHYLSGSVGEMSAIAGKLLDIGETCGYELFAAFARWYIAMGKYLQHDEKGAIEQLLSSEYHFKNFGNQALCMLIKLQRFLLLSQSALTDDVLGEARDAYETIINLNAGEDIAERAMTLFGAIAREAGNYTLAAALFTKSVNYSREKKSLQSLAGTLAHRAKLYFDLNDNAKGEIYLRESFSLASSSNYLSFKDLHFPTFAELSVRAVKAGIFPEYSLRFIEKYYGSKACEYLNTRIEQISPDYLRDFINNFTERFGLAKSNRNMKIKASLLGLFEIAVNGRLIPNSSWKTRKILGIIKYLLLNRGATVTREQLMEIFWPEYDKKAAASSLRVALSEIRKVLSQHEISPESANPLINESTAGIYVAAGSLLTIDAEKFRQLYKKYSKTSKTLSCSEKRSALEEIANIYKGNLFEDDIYEDWPAIEREELKSLFLEVSQELKEVYQELGKDKECEKLCLRILKIDPYNEDACITLIRCYAGRGQNARAIKLFKTFERKLQNELGIGVTKNLGNELMSLITAVK